MSIASASTGSAATAPQPPPPMSVGDAKVVITGDVLSDTSYLRGYNTFYVGREGQITTRLIPGVTTSVVAGVCGVVDVVEKVVSVRGLAPRYVPEVGDVVVGRIAEVCGKRWRCDIGGHHDASMLLANVTQQGGLLRRRGRGDELTMRTIFAECDVFVAEVQRVAPDGSANLHTRSAEGFGRVAGGGQLVVVRPSLVRRVRRHFHTMPRLGVTMVFGVNGWIWVGHATATQIASVLAEEEADGASRNAAGSFGVDREDAEDDTVGLSSSALLAVDISDEAAVRRSVARVANVLRVLNANRLAIHPRAVDAAVYFTVTQHMAPHDILAPANAQLVATDAASRRPAALGKRGRD